MRGTLLILLMLACVAGPADARRHHRHHLRYYDELTPGDTGRQTEPAAAPSASSAPRAQSRSRVVPADWQQQPDDPQFKGQRFVSPDGNASFAATTLPAGAEDIAAHMKAIAFGDGEQITYLRGERTWIAVSGFKQGRIFYRAAVLACGGDRWHQIAFEYPASVKNEMREFVDRAASAVRGSDNSWCDVPVSNQ